MGDDAKEVGFIICRSISEENLCPKGPFVMAEFPHLGVGSSTGELAQLSKFKE
jgi:hypothetical protein